MPFFGIPYKKNFVKKLKVDLYQKIKFLIKKTDNGERFVDLLRRQGVVPGIKVDRGIVPLPGTLGEGTTQGMLIYHKILLI
jgi:fructose-bisphosphate aldolase class 1